MESLFSRTTVQFLAAYETLNFRIAAEKCLVTQPAITKSIKKIESDYNMKLFDKRGSKMIPTEFADDLYKELLSMRDSASSLRLKFESINQGNSGHLNIAVGITLQSSEGFVNLISDLNTNFPNVSLISFGIRNISESEIPFLKKNSSRINIFWAKDKKKWNLSKFKKLIKNKTVYLTFDVDGLDSSIMPATGTPEPGGLLWDETLDILRIAAKNSKIVGADINELSPIKGFNSYNFLVAKLAYKILSYKYLY